MFRSGKAFLLGAVLASSPSVGLAQAQLPLSEAARVFGARESIEHIDISPDGRSLLYVGPGPGRSTAVYLVSLEQKRASGGLRSNGDPETLRWCNFVTDRRMICRITANSEQDGMIVPFGRLYAVDTDSKNGKLLGQSSSVYDARLRQFDGDVLDWLPGSNSAAVLMSREYIPEAGRTGTHLSRSRDGLGVDRVDTMTLKTSMVHSPVKEGIDFITDGRGNVRIMEMAVGKTAGGLATGQTMYRYRLPSGEWRELGRFNSTTVESIIPLAVDADLNAAYVLKKLNGRWALYRTKLDGTLETELVYANQTVDVDNVVRIGRGQRVIGVTFVEDHRQTIYFDPEFKALAASLGKAIPKLPLIRFGGASADGSKLLVHASSDSDPGRYFVYDKGQRALNEIMLARPELEKVRLANVKAVRYPSSDGTSVPAYLTLPPGQENARGLPAVVLPHGGPAARDEWGFDWLSQFLASQGYAVLQPNFRGSAGYGDAWLAQNGFKGWRTSIGDVIAGGKWLASQGIADPSRMAIVGWSYGGYAALQSEVAEPGLFRAIVAIAPVTDLSQLKQEAAKYTNGAIVAEFVGSGPHVREGSPRQNVQRFRTPVLMFHGTRDLNVSVEQARRMHRALNGAGKSSEYLEYAGLEHSLEDSEARAQMLERIGRFLSANLGRGGATTASR